MKDNLAQAPAVLLRLGQVLRRVPVSRATWWRWCRIGYAPAPVRIGENVTAWRGSDIDAFIEQANGGARNTPIEAREAP